MTATIQKGHWARLITNDAAGIVVEQYPDDQPLGNPPQVKVRPPHRFRLWNPESGVDLGWHLAAVLEPCEPRRMGPRTPEMEQAIVSGSKLLMALRKKAACMSDTKRTATLIYRGERFKVLIDPDGWQWRAACIAYDGETLPECLYVTELHESPGEAVGSLVSELIDATELAHAEMAMESERDGMAV